MSATADGSQATHEQPGRRRAVDATEDSAGPTGAYLSHGAGLEEEALPSAWSVLWRATAGTPPHSSQPTRHQGERPERLPRPPRLTTTPPRTEPPPALRARSPQTTGRHRRQGGTPKRAQRRIQALAGHGLRPTRAIKDKQQQEQHATPAGTPSDNPTPRMRLPHTTYRTPALCGRHITHTATAKTLMRVVDFPHPGLTGSPDLLAFFPTCRLHLMARVMSCSITVSGSAGLLAAARARELSGALIRLSRTGRARAGWAAAWRRVSESGAARQSSSVSDRVVGWRAISRSMRLVLAGLAAMQYSRAAGQPGWRQPRRRRAPRAVRRIRRPVSGASSGRKAIRWATAMSGSAASCSARSHGSRVRSATSALACATRLVASVRSSSSVADSTRGAGSPGSRS